MPPLAFGMSLPGGRPRCARRLESRKERHIPGSTVPGLQPDSDASQRLPKAG